jgi:RNA polymerase sigma-70 factor (ECF subfamily)
MVPALVRTVQKAYDRDTPIPGITMPSSEESFLKAFDEYSDTLFRHASFRISNRERAMDITQDTFIKAWDYVRKGQKVQEWKSFLYRVLNNLIIDEYRRKKEQSLDALIEEDPFHANASLAVDSRVAHEDHLDEELLLDKVRTYIPQLSEEHQVVLTLKYVEDLSPKEIALRIGTTENAASVRVHRAIEQLKKLCAHLNTV